MRLRLSALLSIAAVGCQTPRSEIRHAADRGELSQALHLYTDHVHDRGASNPDALSDIAVAVLRRAAQSTDARDRSAAFSALRGLGVHARDLLGVLRREPGVVGDRASAVLFDLDGREGSPPARLFAAAASDDPERIVVGLSALEAARDANAIIAKLESHSADVRRAAAQRLDRFRTAPGATHALEDHAQHDDDAMVRAAAVSALGGHREAGVQVIVESLDDDDMIVQMSAVSALIRASMGRASLVLSPMFSQRPTPLSIEAARSLASRGALDASQFILAALGSRDPDIRAQAAVAASAFNNSQFADLAPYIEDADAEISVRIASLLQSVPSYRTRIVRSMRSLASHPDPMVAIRALGVLAEMGDPSAAGPLRGALTSPETTIRRLAVIAWSRLALASSEVDPLAPALEDPDRSIRLIAAAEIIRMASR